jgi:hypothetical protein
MITGSVAKKRSRPSSVLKNEAGAALVEAALIMIPFLLLLFGVIEFGLLLYDQQVLNNAAREGARAGVVVRDPRLPDADIKAEVINYAKKHLVTFGDDILEETDIVITKINGPTNTKAWGKFADILSVSANYKYKFLFLSNFGISEIALASSNSAARMELE